MTNTPPARQLAGGYAYGHGPVAVERLLLIAKAFGPCTAGFLDRLPLREPRVVLDLGCGPGETTRLLSERFPGAKTLGIDFSRELVDVATMRQPRGISFVVGDVTEAPLAGSPADLIYARLLLAHLHRPTAVVSSWAGQLRSGGALALEEVERIATDDQLFQNYLQIATSALRARGTELFVGPALAEMTPPAGTDVRSRVCVLRPSNRDVARMFALNLETLREDQSVIADYSERQLDAIAEALDARANEEDAPPITWHMRQVIVVRRES